MKSTLHCYGYAISPLPMLCARRVGLAMIVTFPLRSTQPALPNQRMTEAAMLELYCTGIVASMLAYAVFAALADPRGERFPSIGF
jgi:hypothetical protein